MNASTHFNKEQLEAAIAELQDPRGNRSRCELENLSEKLIEHWEAQGKLVLSDGYGYGSDVDVVCDQLSSDPPKRVLEFLCDADDQSLAHLNKKWYKAVGFGEFFEPLWFWWAGNGDPVWLTDFKIDHFSDWVLNEVEEMAGWEVMK